MSGAETYQFLPRERPAAHHRGSCQRQHCPPLSTQSRQRRPQVEATETARVQAPLGAASQWPGCRSISQNARTANAVRMRAPVPRASTDRSRHAAPWQHVAQATEMRRSSVARTSATSANRHGHELYCCQKRLYIHESAVEMNRRTDANCAGARSFHSNKVRQPQRCMMTNMQAALPTSMDAKYWRIKRTGENSALTRSNRGG